MADKSDGHSFACCLEGYTVFTDCCRCCFLFSILLCGQIMLDYKLVAGAWNSFNYDRNIYNAIGKRLETRYQSGFRKSVSFSRRHLPGWPHPIRHWNKPCHGCPRNRLRREQHSQKHSFSTIYRSIAPRQCQ